MSELIPFDFSEEIIQSFRDKKEIPVHFYNKSGQILIYKMEDATNDQIERLLRFVNQGVYYRQEDEDKLGIKSRSDVPEGLSDTLLLSEEVADELNADVSELFYELKKTSITSFQAKRSSERLANVFSDFENQPDAMTGLVNIIQLMGNKDTEYEVQLAVKRTVVAMAMKTRGMIVSNFNDKKRMQAQINDLMMAAMLADVGYTKMKVPAGMGLNSDEMAYIRNHPLLSYLSVAHETTITPGTKRNILMHHHPLKHGIKGNSYPDLRWLLKKLLELRDKYNQMPGKEAVVKDIVSQLKLLRKELPYDEDANILSIASEFASLTSKVPWRDPFHPVQAVKMIVNNSYFTYTDRIIRDFLDYAAISLCDNQMIIRNGDFIITAAQSPQSERTFFELCLVSQVDRYQSRPEVQRIAFIEPKLETSPRMQIIGFEEKSLKKDPRKAHYRLANDDTRRIIYIIDPVLNPLLYSSVKKLLET